MKKIPKLTFQESILILIKCVTRLSEKMTTPHRKVPTGGKGFEDPILANKKVPGKGFEVPVFKEKPVF